MIRVTLELVSANGAGRDRPLGVLHISNAGPSPHGGTTYEVRLSKNLPGRTAETWKKGRAAIEAGEYLNADFLGGSIVGFDNVKRGAWDLLYLCLRCVIGSRNPTPIPAASHPVEARAERLMRLIDEFDHAGELAALREMFIRQPGETLSPEQKWLDKLRDDCDHKFIDSPCCLKCGWTPPKVEP